jgi:hypothetical protein
MSQSSTDGEQNTTEGIMKKKMACGGKTKGYKAGGKVCPACKSAKCKCKKMSAGGMCRGGGAATRGKSISKKMG